MTNIIWVSAAVLMIFGFWFILSIRVFSAEEAVVISKKVQVHSGPTEKLPVLFHIHEGHELRIKQQKALWTEVQSSNGFRGWLKSDTIVSICEDL